MAGVRPKWSPLVWVRVFLTRVRKTDAGCWEWTGQRSGRSDTGGQYGTVRKNGRMQYAHRAYYEFDRGPVPEELQLDHLCRNRLCVNPDHLEPVTRAENVRRGVLPNSEKTHCVNNHPFDAANTYWTVRSTGRSRRTCRACRNDRKRSHRAAMSAAAQGA